MLRTSAIRQSGTSSILEEDTGKHSAERFDKHIQNSVVIIVAVVVVVIIIIIIRLQGNRLWTNFL